MNNLGTWDIVRVESKINKSFKDNSELQLLEILKNNTFLFYELYLRKFTVKPIFSEIIFGNNYRCDFAWLNDNSDGPEWVLVEIEKPKLKLFKKNKEPRAELNHAIEQIKSWDRYFKENPSEKKRIFGAVSRFRFVLVGGLRKDWQTENAIKWRTYQNQECNIEIRSIDIFKDAIKIAIEKFHLLSSFEKYPKTLKHSELENYWKEYGYMDNFRQIL